MFISMREGFVEEDGKEGPNEDFSNNVEYFLFEPSVLKIRSPKVYEWFSGKYGDKLQLRKVVP